MLRTGNDQVNASGMPPEPLVLNRRLAAADGVRLPAYGLAPAAVRRSQHRVDTSA